MIYIGKCSVCEAAWKQFNNISNKCPWCHRNTAVYTESPKECKQESYDTDDTFFEESNRFMAESDVVLQIIRYVFKRTTKDPELLVVCFKIFGYNNKKIDGEFFIKEKRINIVDNAVIKSLEHLFTSKELGVVDNEK